MFFLILIDTAILILLSFLHIYWSLGGNWGMSAVLPTLSDGQTLFRPGIFAKLGVGAVLGAFAFIIPGNLGIYDKFVNHDFIRYATTAIGLLFALRAMGDFRYIGFFRKATGTAFAINDRRYYSPLSVVVAVISIAVAWIN